MRDEPYPSRYYATIEEESRRAPTAAAFALPGLRGEMRRALILMIALYLLGATFFAFSARIQAAPSATLSNHGAFASPAADGGCAGAAQP
jgi:hypothetical protein